MKARTLIILAVLLLVACEAGPQESSTPETVPGEMQASPTLLPLSPAPSRSARTFATGTPYASLTFQRTASMTPSPFATPAGAVLTPDYAASLTARAVAHPSYTPTPIVTLQPGAIIQLTWVDMHDALTGWGIEAHGKLVHTRDGGRSWMDVSPSAERYLPGGFYSLDGLQAWAIPHQPGWYSSDPSAPLNTMVWRTADGGASWQASQTLCLYWDCGTESDVSPAYVYPVSLQFPDENTGWLLVTVDHHMFQDRYRIFRSTDGGLSWEFAADNVSGPWTMYASGLAGLDAQTGWLSLDQAGGAFDPSARWGFYRTGDGGATWDYFSPPAPDLLPEDFSKGTPDCGTISLHFLPLATIDTDVRCYVYEVTIDAPTPSYTFHFHSPDGGASWQSWQSSGSVDFIGPLAGWRIVVPGASQLKQLQQTTDGGRTWTTISQVSWPQAQLDFQDGQNGWALVGSGEAAVLVHTRDGGRTWVQVVPRLGP